MRLAAVVFALELMATGRLAEPCAAFDASQKKHEARSVGVAWVGVW